MTKSAKDREGPDTCCKTHKQDTIPVSTNEPTQADTVAVNPLSFVIDGANSPRCVKKIETALAQVNGVRSAIMNFAERTVMVEGEVDVERVIRAIEEVGYQGKPGEMDSQQDALDEKEQADRQYVKKLMSQMTMALGLGVPLMVFSLVGGEVSIHTATERFVWLIIGILTFVIMLISGKHFYVSAWQAFKHHSANKDTLIALGTVTAWLYSMVVVLFPHLVPQMARHVYFEATAMIIGLIDLGLALEIKARSRTSESIKRLIGLQSKTARVIRDDNERDIPIDQVIVHDVVKIRPGEKIPVDGEVVQGRTTVDNAMLTGEPLPAEIREGNAVVAGTINQSGSLLCKTTRVGKDTALAQIIHRVKRAQNSTPPIGRLADVVSVYFVPVVMIVAVVTALAWLNLGPQPAMAYAMVSATTVLLIACPCALGLATPMSVMVGVGKAAEAGILIRNGEALQSVSTMTAMILDKTGTITLGSPTVTDVIPVGDYDKLQILQLAASVGTGSEHPLARAIVESATERGLRAADMSECQAITGQGVEAIVGAHYLLLGNEKLMSDRGIAIEDHVPAAHRLAADARTPMFLAVDNCLAGIIAVADPIKPDSLAAISRLQQAGVRVVMVTSDNAVTARAVATKVGINEVFAEVLPGQRAEKVAQLQMDGEVVGMSGDGMNDAPSLAMANVGFAIGTGTDVASERADVTLMRGSLHGLADAIAVSKATLTNSKQNLTGAFIYHVAGIPLAAGVFYSLSGVLLSPVMAAAAMAFLSFTVVSNANRLRCFKTNEH